MSGILLLSLGLSAGAATPSYHVSATLPLGGEGGWDYLTVDEAARRLYISRSSHVMVVDIDANTVVGDIPDTPGVHGIALAPDLHRGFTSNGKANTVTIFDLKTLQVLGHAKTGGNPDAIVYEPVTKRVFAFNGKSKDATVIDAATGTTLRTIPLGGKPEFATTDGQGELYVNIEDTHELVTLDGRTMAVDHRWTLVPGEEPTGMGLDAAHHRAFSGCGNKMMTILDTDTGILIGTVPIGDHVDGNGYDPGTGLAFSANGDGTLTVVGETSPGQFAAVATVPTAVGARTMAIDPRTHRIFLPAARYLPAAKATTENPKPRPTMIKDSFVLLVVSP